MMNSTLKNIILLFVLLLLVGSIFLWSAIYLPLSPGSSKIVDFTLEKGQGAKQISIALKEQGIVKYGSIFRFYALMIGKAEKLQAGSYEVSSAMSIAQIVSKFLSGDVITEKLTIVEGWDLRDISKYFVEQGISKDGELLTLAKKDYSFGLDSLKDKPKDADLEGYLFPDTYEFIPGTSTEDILKKILSTFDDKFTPELRAEIARQNKSIFEIVTMASLIEKEVKSPEDKKMVSGILWKRIDIGMPLQVDATVVYVINKQPSLEDLQIDSPYNTYRFYGLPKGPISSPGLDSIIAAIYPTESNYLFYLSAAEDGRTIFSKTFAEHAAAIRKYLR